MPLKKLTANAPLAHSADLVATHIAQLKAIFPELVTEGPQGACINIDVLKALVGDATATDADEKYGLNWHGKRSARQLALTPSTGTLRPCPEESLDWDNTKNLMIEGDNLEVLKLLQKSYAGKVKLIYIDPPYNTGKDFVYPDNFQDSIKNYLELTGQAEGGQKISSNTDTSGRFHTDWLNMMYPRLKLARNLLREDGVIFITIDDSEVSNLRKICDEVFGTENFIANIVWQKKYAPQNDATYFSDMHDHILVYAKLAKRSKNDQQGWSLDLLARTESQNDAYKNTDQDPRGAWKASDLSVKTYSSKNDYTITTPSGRIVNSPESRCWAVSEERFLELVADHRIWFGANGNNVPSLKRFLHEVQDGTVPVTWWTYQDCGHNQDAKKELKELFATDYTDTIFDTPKPVQLISRMLQLATKSDPESLVLDFFAGSGTTGQAVYEMNLVDSGNRRFILVQLPEPLDPNNKDQKTAADFCDQLGKPRTIAELTKERLRRAAIKIRATYAQPEGATSQLDLNIGAETPATPPDLGFRVFKLDHSNIRAWNPINTDVAQAVLDNTEHLMEGRTEADIVFELLLKRGLDLCAPMASRTIAGKTVGAVDGGKLMTCLADHISAEDVEALAQGMAAWRVALAPDEETTCIFRDSAFENDVAKTNLAAILNQSGIATVRSL